MRRRKPTFVDEMMNEVISYGGLPVRRHHVYQDVLKRTGSKWAADLFAFGPRARAIEAEPITLEELEALP